MTKSHTAAACTSEIILKNRKHKYKCIYKNENRTKKNSQPVVVNADGIVST